MPSWWNRRTVLEKWLLVFIIVLLIFLLAFFVALMGTLGSRMNSDKTYEKRCGKPVYYSNIRRSLVSIPKDILRRSGEEANESDSSNVCRNPHCIHTASKLLMNIDEKVDPCDDFYNFACGSFIKKTTIPADKSLVNIFTLTTERLYDQIRSLLEEPVSSDEPRPFQLAKIIYQACMNTTVIEGRGAQPLLDMLRRLGGWPVLEGDSWDESSFSWKDSVYRFRDAGYSVDYFLDFSISVDVKNSTRNVIDLDQASLGLSREYLNRGFSDKLVQAYYEYMVDIATLLGADKSRAEIELKDSLQFEMKLANISLPVERRMNATILYNPMTIAELTNNFPSIPWLEYINSLLAPHLKVGPEEITNVNVPKYISDLEELLRITPKRVQANYAMWRVAHATVTCLTEAFRYRQLAYDTVKSGKTERESRWKECSDITSNSMSIAVGALYIRKYFNEKWKVSALEIVNDIMQQFRKILTKVEWMDYQTRTAALEKADSIALNVAYPQEMLDDQKLTDYYSGLEISDKFMESALNLNLFDYEHSIGKLRKPINRTDWVNHGRIAVANAIYSLVHNTVDVPAGILQGAFFSAERPAYMNYGAIGFVIGHEITHGFDDIGRQFDKNGNLENWWQEITKQHFREKSKCIIDQYSNYKVTEVGLKLNGVNTQGENIADNGGIKEAYYAYQAWTQRHGEESRLPGLEKYTPKQLFWLSAANTWCAVYRNEAIKLRITTGFHAPSRFRVVGPMSNMEEFARDFKCPAGSQMNPQSKCKVW